MSDGSFVTTNPAGMSWSTTSLIVGISWVKDSAGNMRTIFQDSNGNIQTEIPPIAGGGGPGGGHRTSWRELTN